MKHVSFFSYLEIIIFLNTFQFFCKEFYILQYQGSGKNTPWVHGDHVYGIQDQMEENR